MYVIFVGFGHSGHSLLGALLDAHPNAAVANELNVLKQMRTLALSFDDLWRLTLGCSSHNQHGTAWTNTGYQYLVDGGSHGTVVDPKVVGDKKGGGTARMIDSDPAIWETLVNQAAGHLRVVNVLRHPLDMLAAAAYRRGIQPDKTSADRIITNANAVLKSRQSVPTAHGLTFHHEAFLAAPKAQLRELCSFLGLTASDDYLNACVKGVRTRANQRRFSVDWSSDLLTYFEKALSQPELAALFSAYLPLRNGGELT